MAIQIKANKQKMAQIPFHSKRPDTIPKMNEHGQYHSRLNECSHLTDS